MNHFSIAAVVLHNRGRSEIFNAAAVEWVNGLASRDPIVEQIAQNVIDKYLRGLEIR